MDRPCSVISAQHIRDGTEVRQGCFTNDLFILGLLRGMLPLLFVPAMHNGRPYYGDSLFQSRTTQIGSRKAMVLSGFHN
jgi:hypothetical protein